MTRGHVALRTATLLIGFVAVMLGVWAQAAGAAKPDLPPAEIEALTKVFKAQLQPYGLRITRGLLQNPSNYKPDPEGTHLALYVEPKSNAYTSADYVKNFSKLTREFVPMVFNRWPGLESLDICQEPLNDTREAPPPVTQIFLSRSALDRVANWKKASLSELLAAVPKASGRGSGYHVYFNADTRADPSFVKAADAADYPMQTPFGY